MGVTCKLSIPRLEHACIRFGEPQAHFGVVDLQLAVACVDDVLDAVDRQRRLRDVRRLWRQSMAQLCQLKRDATMIFRLSLLSKILACHLRL